MKMNDSTTLSNERSFWNNKYRTDKIGSGRGSRGKFARKKKSIIQSIIDKQNIRSVLDLGCGDLFWIKDLNVKDYVGVDFSDVTLENNKKLRPDWKFYTFDFSKREVPWKAELVLLIDILQHQPTIKQYKKVFENAVNSATKYLIVTSWKKKQKFQQKNNVWFYETLNELLHGYTYDSLYSYRKHLMCLIYKKQEK